MEEEKKEGLENVEGQRRLPPRPMPPRPPLMKKQIVIEGEKEQAVVENLLFAIYYCVRFSATAAFTALV